jgi:hypothetical protein
MPDPVDISAYTDEQKLAFFQGDGAPVQPEGYADMAADHPAKISYDESKAANDAIIAVYQSAVDNGQHPAPSE